jgi:hypothetical protein
MKSAYTIHELVIGGERVSPNSVVELDEKTFAELDALGAIRDATEDEAAIAGLTAKKAAPAQTAQTAPAPRQTAAEKKAAAKKAEEDAAAAKKVEEDAAAAAVDPDVVPDPNADADLLGDN